MKTSSGNLSGNNRGPKLVGDIGGTNARFAMVNSDSDEAGSIDDSTIRVLACKDFPSLAPALKAYLKEFNVAVLDEAAIAVGMPVTGDFLSMTNNDWSFSQQQIRDDFALDHLAIINDFAALALALPHLAVNGLVKVGGGQIQQGQTKALIGPGTGLGVSGLITTPDGQRFPIQGEGGHASMAPLTSREFAVAEWLRAKFTHASSERILSGPGLCLLHEALLSIDGKQTRPMSAAEITRLAMDDTDSTCVEVLDIFCSQLGASAANLALIFGATGGVYIGGGIVPRLGSYLEQSSFRVSFEAKGRMSDYLSGISTQVIVEKYPTLIGAATLLNSAVPNP